MAQETSKWINPVIRSCLPPGILRHTPIARDHATPGGARPVAMSQSHGRIRRNAQGAWDFRRRTRFGTPAAFDSNRQSWLRRRYSKCWFHFGCVMKPALVAALGVGVAVPAFGLLVRYRRDLNAARARLAAVERHVISTHWGEVEYAERGNGDPVLVVHGIFHNCIGGLLSVRDLFTDRRVIAPSRFGYLGSDMPPNATPAA